MTATDQSAADPACIDEPTLWAVHVTGPDDLLPCASRRLAARNAMWFNLGNIRNLQSLDAEHAPLTYATPVPWTGTAEGHAEALARENQADVRWSDPDADVLDGLMRSLTGTDGPTTVVYEIDCPHCDDDSTAVIRTLALNQPEDDGAIHIDVGMSVAQSTFECTVCGCAVYTGDVEASTEDDECPNEDSDDEDDQDDDEDEEATR